MKFRDDVLERYLAAAPIPLAMERALEARLLARHRFERPILDIGCGEGLFAAMLFAEKIDTGIDPDARELERANQLDAYDELIECSGSHIERPDDFYRTILSNSVIEHIVDVEAVLREARRLLSPGGSFYVTVPSHLFDRYTIVNQLLTGLGLHGLAARYRTFFNAFWKHHHFHDPEGWRDLARRCGFEVRTLHMYGTKRQCMLNDLLAPFSLVSFLVKKATNRWVLFPALRRIVMKPVAAFGRRWLNGGDHLESGGGLVFMELTK
jgi:SAM-dependent methyltransferase